MAIRSLSGPFWGRAVLCTAGDADCTTGIPFGRHGLRPHDDSEGEAGPSAPRCGNFSGAFGGTARGPFPTGRSHLHETGGRPQADRLTVTEARITIKCVALFFTKCYNVGYYG